MRYPVIIHKDRGSDYGVTVPDLPGCFSAGETLEEALGNAEEAVLTHVEGLLLDDETVPSPTDVETLRRKLKRKNVVWGIVSVDLSKLSERAKRINITIPDRLLSKIDSFAESEGESRSGLLASAALEYMSARSLK
jgi:predicted RNase H-like HicB family nuclease